MTKEPDSALGSGPGSGNCWPRAGLFFGIAVCGAALDLATKYWVFDAFYSGERVGQEPYWWWPGVLGVQASTNPGALFGLGQGYSLWFAGASVLFFAFILTWLFVFGGFRDRLLTIALALVTGGIFGNFYDRIGWGHLANYPDAIRHHVRDWIHFRLAGVPGFDPWPNFNIADSCLVIGAGLLIVHSLLMQRRSLSSPSTAAPQPVTGKLPAAQRGD